jgi:alkylation response protein AidB-like acyl-CoA dehydrogenase
VVTATDEPEAPAVVEWAPSWPPLGWVWESRGDRLRLFGPGPGVDPGSPALAFGASGTATAALSHWPVAGTWTLPAGGGLAVRGRARLWAAAVTLGIAQAAFDATVAYATERVVFGRPVAHHQGNAFELAASAAGLHGARLLVYDAARRFDAWDAGTTEHPVDAGFWATEAFLETTETAGRVTDLGIQLLGGHGFLVDHLAEKRFREARMLGLFFGGRARAEDDLACALVEVGAW